MALYPPAGGYLRFYRWERLPVSLQHAGYATALPKPTMPRWLPRPAAPTMPNVTSGPGA